MGFQEDRRRTDGEGTERTKEQGRDRDRNLTFYFNSPKPAGRANEDNSNLIFVCNLVQFMQNLLSEDRFSFFVTS